MVQLLPYDTSSANHKVLDRFTESKFAGREFSSRGEFDVVTDHRASTSSISRHKKDNLDLSISHRETFVVAVQDSLCVDLS